MRRGSEPAFVMNDAGEFCGVNLSSDFCAEHEWGIKGLQRVFGIRGEGYGVERRRVSQVILEHEVKNEYGSALRFFKVKGGHWCLAYGHLHHLRRIEDRGEDSDLRLWEKSSYRKSDEIAAAWDEGTFGVMVRSGDKDKLEAVFKALCDKDAAIMLGGGGVFQNAGLCLFIISKLSKSALDVMRDTDLDREKVRLAGEATGIEEVLNKAGRSWFSLRPAWIRDKAASRYPVWFWLNPQNQQKYEAGWYTVEDLRQWAENKGPVLKIASNRMGDKHGI